MAKYMDSENFKHFWNNILKPNLLKKVDKVSGKGLSTNDFTDTYKNAIGSLQDSVGALNTTKVDKVIGKDLSTNDFTNEYKDLIVANKDAISKLKGFIYPCTAQALEGMSTADLVGIYNQGYRAVQTTNNETVVTLGLAADGSLEWQGCNEDTANVLGNPNFAIAQAGYGGMHGSQIYAADRWMGLNTAQTQYTNGMVNITDDGTGNCAVVQAVDSGEGGEFTVNADITPPSGGKWQIVVFNLETGSPAVIASSNGDETKTPILNVTVPPNIKIWIGLYPTVGTPNGMGIVGNARLLRGSYTPKTLPPWEDIDSVVNLIRCRDYYRSLSAYGFVGIAVADTTNSVQGVIFGDSMRIYNPSMLGTFVVFTPTASTNISSFQSVSYQGNGFRFIAQTTGGISVGTVGFLVPSPENGAISADM